MIHPIRDSLGRLRAVLLGRINAALAEKYADAATVASKSAEAEKAIGDGSILEWLVAELPQFIAELAPLVQAVLTLLSLFGK